jgi:hypothetical protein
MEKLCTWLMLLSFLAVVVLMAYTYVAGPQPWTRAAFIVAVLAWLGGTAVYFLSRRA